jgi:hypothetical protein
MNKSEMLEVVNEWRALEGKDPLKNWKRSLEALEQVYYDAAAALSRHLQSAGGHVVTLEESAELSSESSDPETPPEAIEVTTEVHNVHNDDPEDAEGHVVTPKSGRGLIMQLSIDLLTSRNDPYQILADEVRARYPDAKTSARSLASVAVDLRKAGVRVPERAKPQKKTA